MATVHTEYGPGRIIDQETVRGRTRYKVAGEGFEVWVDQTKLGGYERPDEIDFNAPHWQGHEPMNGLSMYTDPVPPMSEDEYAEYTDPRGLRDRDRMRTHPDYLDDSDEGRYYANRRQAGPGRDYADREMRGLSRGDYEGYDPEYDPRGEYSGLAHDPGLSYDDDPDSRFYAKRRRQAAPGDRFVDKHFQDIVHDDPYSDFGGDEDVAEEYGLRSHSPEVDEDEGRYYANRQVVPGKAGRPSHLAWAPLDDDNSTDLPYNPQPQHDAVTLGGDDNSSTIQPIHHIDADERLRSSDSISFDDAADGEEPGPNPDLFAREGSFDREAAHTLLIRKWLQKEHPHVYKKMFDTGKGLVQNIPGVTPGMAEKIMHGTEGASDAANMAVPLGVANRAVDRTLNALDPGYGSGWGGVIHNASVREANPLLLALPAIGEALAGEGLGAAAGAAARAGAGMAVNQGLHALGDQGLHALGDAANQEGGPEMEDSWNLHGASYRPAGLSDRYIDITAGADYHNDPVAQFRHDPDAYINRIGHLMDEGLNPRFAEYMDLVEGDASVRTAAWKDVRKKAMRLKREGAVHVKDIAPHRIMAHVDGDHGTYQVLVLKTGSFGGLSGGQSISNWHCNCEWGKWAFRRKFSYVGRLCSHAYASYLTMQSAAMKGQPRTRRSPADMKTVKRNPRDREYLMPLFSAGRRTADALQDGPKRLTPDMVVNDTDDAQMFLDVTKDERTDTGPDDVVSDKDIVHFARLMRHCEVTESPYPRELVAFLSRYASEADDTQADYRAHDADDANGALSTLRADADRDQEDDFGTMADRVHRIQDAVEDARANGADASRFVAAVHKMAEDPKPTPEVPAWQANGVNSTTTAPGAGLIKNFTDYWKNKYENSAFNALSSGQPAPANDKPNDKGVSPDGDRGKGGGNGPHGGPAEKSRGVDALGESLYGIPDKTPAVQGTDNRAGVPVGVEFDKGTGGTPKPGPVGQSPAVGQDGNAGTGAGAKNSGGMTSGPVSDGGKAGAENGNNSSIGKDQLDADGYYTVQKGDTLSDIAQRAYGDMNKYQDIAKNNKDITNVDQINEGQRIKIDNPTGNGGLSGDVTNPSGSTKAVTGPAVDTAAGTPAVDVSAVSDSKATGTNAGASVGVDTPATPPAPAAAEAPKAAEQPAPAQKPATATTASAKAWLRWAADGDGTSTNQTADSTTQSDTASASSNPASGPSTSTNGRSAPATNPAQTRPGTPSKDETYDPANPAQVQQQSMNSANPGAQAGGSNNGLPSMGTGSGMGMGDIGNLIGQGVGAASSIASGIGGALPGLASGIGSALSGIGSIFSSKQDAEEWRRYAYPAGAGDDDNPKTLPHLPFNGSGNPGRLDFSSSEEYADEARKKMDDVTDLGDHDVHTPMGEWQKQSSLDEEGFDPYREASIGYSTDDNSDIVRTFQAHLGETALGAGAGRGAGRFDDIAGAAQGFLRTAGRNYSLAEQSELIREGDKGGARNLGSLDLKGTHYEDMHTLGW